MYVRFTDFTPELFTPEPKSSTKNLIQGVWLSDVSEPNRRWPESTNLPQSSSPSLINEKTFTPKPVSKNVGHCHAAGPDHQCHHPWALHKHCDFVAEKGFQELPLAPPLLLRLFSEAVTFSIQLLTSVAHTHTHTKLTPTVGWKKN
jgi:hypothetical protein